MALRNMPRVQVSHEQGRPSYELDGRKVDNGATLMLRLRGNAGWTPVEVTGLPRILQIRTTAEDGMSLVTTLPYEAEVRWPNSHDDV